MPSATARAGPRGRGAPVRGGAVGTPSRTVAAAGARGRRRRVRLDELAAFVLGVRRRPALPAHVHHVVGRQDADSEILVCIVQSVAIVGFAVLYALSPKAFDATVPFAPVPWTLAAYAGFTAFRLRLALKRRLGRRMLRVSVVVDIAVLMVTIWSFHLQYQAPPAIYLKAPTLMYVFILIALRALRLEAEFVLWTGGAAAVGWLALVGYAGWAGSAPITHDFETYVTSYALLLGAELDKVVSIVATTLVLALAVQRARRLLVASVAEEQAASALSRYLAPEVARRVRDGESVDVPGRGVVREATILVADLRAFTNRTQGLDPAATIAALTDWHERVVPVIHAEQGSIDKYLGDGVLASFGALAPSDADAAQALRAAERIVEEARAWRRERARAGRVTFEVGIAVVSGSVLAGPVGHASRLEYTVLGAPVNIAAKLEKHAKVEGTAVVATAATVARAERQGWHRRAHLVRRPARRVSGLEEPQDLVTWPAPPGAGG